jgi:iron complex transport system permease protein
LSAFPPRFTTARARFALWRARRTPDPRLGTVLAGAAVGASVLVAAGLGAAEVPWREVPRALVDATHPAHVILWQIRLPRIVAGVLVGTALATAGALLQAVVRNPLADPQIMGVTAGAGLGGLVGILLLPDVRFAIPVSAFVGGLGATLVVLTVAWTGRGIVVPLRILLSGVGVQALLFSAVALLMYAFADRAPAFIGFTIGSLAGVGWPDVALAAGPTILGATLALASTRALNLLLLDDASAAGIGLHVERARLGAACLAALLAAGAVSVAGLVGFVGLVVPNAVRLATGPDHRVLMPLAMLGGAALVVLADAGARTLAAPLELPVGALLALVGGPYFLVELWRKVG